MKNCLICSKILVAQQTKYCSIKCKAKAHYNKHKTNTNSTYSQFKRFDIRKKEFINKLGGKCSKCGYNKNYAALHFHHLKDKSFPLDARHIGNSSLKKLELELKKCILLCANCHAEEHYPHCSFSGSS